MTGHSAAIAGLTSCAASATVASKSFFIVSSYAETNGGCEQKLLIVPLTPRPRDHYYNSRSFTVAARPQLPEICRALASDSRSAFEQQGLCEMWPTIANPKFDTPVRLRARGKQGVMPFKAGDRLETVAASWCGSQTSVELARARLVFGFSVRGADPRPLSAPSPDVSCKMRLSCFAQTR